MSSRLIPRLHVLALAAWESLLTLGRRRPPTAPKRILIAHHLLLGDTLMLTPLLAKLRERYPKAEVIMTTPKVIAPLYQKRPYGVRAVPYDPRDAATLKALLGMRGFDLAIVPGDNRHAWLARALGARWVVAFAGDRPVWKNWPVDQLIPYPDAPAAWGDMVAGLVDGPPPAPYRPEDWLAPDCAPFALPQQPYCVLHIGASSPLKLWPPEKWRVLADYLTQQGYDVVWSGGKNEQKLVMEIDPGNHYSSLAGQLDLAQLWGLIQKANLLVCPDTGVAHLGRIANTPTLTLFGPGSAVICGAGSFWRNNPYHAVTIEDIPCRNQHILFKREISWVRRCGRSIRECRVAKCTNAIEANTVIQAAATILWPIPH